MNCTSVMAQSSATGTSSRRHYRDHDASSSGSSRYADSDWETKEAMLQRELEEAKARTAQMAKTMRWWSECTANWREKCSKVRNERNQAREESKHLRNKLETITKDADTYKHEFQKLEMQNDQLKREIEKIYEVLTKHAVHFDEHIDSILDSDSELKTYNVELLLDIYNNVKQNNESPSKESSSNVDIKCREESKDIEEYILQGAVPKHAVELHGDSILAEINEVQYKSENCHTKIDLSNDDLLIEKMSMLHLRLEEATKTIAAEREENSSLHRGIEKLRVEVNQLREECEELQDSKAEAMRELVMLKDQFQGELNAAQADLIDEAANREGMDRRLSELRIELERLQAENAAEWGKRERLETEKISLERENKQLRIEVQDLQERIEIRRLRPPSTYDAEAKPLQQEVLDRSKEITDLKHSYSKLKKILTEKTTELSHALRRSEQYEAEVKRLRARVEELKKELASSQDEVDGLTNNVRRLQRTNEYLVEQLESTNMQLDHFRNSNSETRAPDVVAEIMDDKTRNDNDDENEDEDDNEEDDEYEDELLEDYEQ